MTEHRTRWIRDPADPATQLAFYLGTHQPRWLEHSPVPLMVSARTLAKYRRRRREGVALIPGAEVGADVFPNARVPWALDSGGFTELSMYGHWTMDAEEYGGMVARFMVDGGWPPVFAAPQDWMCEPSIRAKTGHTVADHQEFTVHNYLQLREEFPFVPWLPVLQGWTVEDYLAHADAYHRAGVDLTAEPLVGLGSVCRLQDTVKPAMIAQALHDRDITRLHGFGIKVDGLASYGHLLASADSLAWSFAARRRRQRLSGCTHRGPCNNCLAYALAWREHVLAGLRTPKPLRLSLDAPPRGQLTLGL
jgi:hypothetical protein